MDDFIKFRNNAHSRWSYRHNGRVKSAIKYRVNKFNIPLEYFNGIKYMNELNDKTIQYIKDNNIDKPFKMRKSYQYKQHHKTLTGDEFCDKYNELKSIYLEHKKQYHI